ncbi:glucosamine-6-phosphate deaminase [Patescibacteria group bacterium]|nr:glucosamine-6-phosphate deaminase [Patescibacteria group bacterium]MBU4512120.1 glucosamine-6-phosphate deaminase [Patescibacteria group bacterium]MCG2692523.1 glucosamine-6-phosphate deaminase [Candidatus Parcubacteria bacterium]
MKVIICEDYMKMSKKAAEVFTGQIKEKPDSVLGFATGSTPAGLYQELIKACERGEVDFSQITSFNLDEYYKISPDNEQSYHYFMREQLFDHINIKSKNIHMPSIMMGARAPIQPQGGAGALAPTQAPVPDGETKDIKQFCTDYEEAIIQAGGIDLQVLGIGKNGHIAFNEPGSSSNSRTRLVDLTQDTINANSRFFDKIDEVPKQAITMGLATIMECKKIIMLANGSSKAEAMVKALEGSVTEEVPASILQKHSEVIFIMDKEAGGLLS